MRPGLYVHVPFCSAICPYCDFAVRVGDAADGAGFVDSLLVELNGLATGDALSDLPAVATAVSRLVAGEFGRFDTIYLGGGTPSVLAERDLRRLLEALRERLPVDDDVKFFFEANPEDVTAQSLRLWNDLGVSMLSLGIQSFDSDQLRFLGRRHHADEARRAVQMALEAGFDTVSIDLIYGLPGQTEDAWRRELETAAHLDPQHLSCYELEIHPRTVFGKRSARGELRELSEDDQADLFLLTHRHLAEHGFEGYEVSNFARSPEHRSAHNAKYWHHVPYLGLGPSAHSYAPTGEGGVRWWNERHTRRWARSLGEGRAAVDDHEALSFGDLAFEALMLGLRTVDGVDCRRLERDFGVDILTGHAKQIEIWRVQGLVTRTDHRIRPTVAGMALADRLVTDLQLEHEITTEIDRA
ncbi:MAG: radical SAM family heme chaperone HemW [Thermoanaerobaculia bacterium]|nr:radical SAM family heme chaperone HemW [Thermoanaerobaculia bacterium]